MKFMSSVHIGNEFFIGAEDGNIYQFNPNENGSHVLIDYFAASICDYDPTAASKSSSLGRENKGAAKPKKKSSKCYVFALYAIENSSYGNILLSGTSNGDVILFKIGDSVSGRQILPP